MLQNLTKMRKSQFSESLNKNMFLKKMSENEKCILNMYFKQEKIKPGTLWRLGDNPDYCLMILSGEFLMKF